MSASDHLDWFALERFYYEGCRLFLRSEYDQAIAKFKRVYEETPDLWDVAELVEGYYALPRGQWIAKYRPQVEIRVSPNRPVERKAAGGLLRRLQRRLTAAIAHVFR